MNRMLVGCVWLSRIGPIRSAVVGWCCPVDVYAIANLRLDREWPCVAQGKLFGLRVEGVATAAQYGQIVWTVGVLTGR